LPRIFAYCRVSTVDQTTQNQILEIKAAGFAIEAHRFVEESISGSVAAKGRPGFTALGGVDLTSPAGKMTMQVIAAVAEFERDLLIERTQSGIIRAKAAGKQFGRPPTLNVKERNAVLEGLDAGASITEMARKFKTTRQTIMRVREAALKLPQNPVQFDAVCLISA
jgi:putative DNA-invertase from lambdoid prophage Rac